MSLLKQSSDFKEEEGSLILRNVQLTKINIDAIKKKLVEIKSPLANITNDAVLYKVAHIDFNNNNLMSLVGIEVFDHIVHLNIAKNSIAPSSLSCLSAKAITTITHINLSQNKLKNIPWKELKILSNLIDMVFDYNNVEDINPNEVLAHSAFSLPLKSISSKRNKIRNF